MRTRILGLLSCFGILVGCDESTMNSEVDEAERAFLESCDLLELPNEVINAISDHATNKHLVVSKKSERVKDELEVTTGDFYDGRGEVFRFRREADSWRFVSQSIWVE